MTETTWQCLSQTSDLKQDLRILYDDIFLRELKRSAGAGANAAELFNGIDLGVRAYLNERRDMTRRKPGKLEARKLEAISDAAYALSVALNRIASTPNAKLNLSNALMRVAADEAGRGAALISLANEAFGPGDPLTATQNFADLLMRTSAEIARKSPGPSPEDKRERGQIFLSAELERWEKRPRKTETQPVRALAAAFRPVWERNSTHPYTEGMYDPKLRRTVSHAVDAVHRIGRKLDPKLSRARVVTAFRDLPTA
jgi:hypothetical protein